jgi:hypothetical protein
MVYLVTEPGGYEESDVPRGIYSTLELAREAAKVCDGYVYEVTLDAPPSDLDYVREEVKHWWDK